MSFGASEYVGLAFACIAMSILIQIFGSPFLKSTFIIWSLAFGCLVATAGKDVDGDGTMDSYFRADFLAKAKPITFLWAEGTYPIGFSGTNFLPILIGFLISSAETIGDVTMTCVYSNVTEEADVASRIQGGLLADGVNSFLATLFGSPPNTTFSQNNGLIALTKCASRSAGFACGFWLIAFGIIGPLGAAFSSIPICVVGGVVLQMFSSVLVSGMLIATSDFTRRNQFILMLSLGVGLGVAMEGHIFDWPGPYTFYRRNLAYDYGFWPEKLVCTTPKAPWIHTDGYCHTSGPFGQNNGNCCAVYDEGAKMWRKLILMILKTPYGIGFVIAFVLNLVIPKDSEEGEDSAKGTSAKAVETSSA
jgi:NCS2 family nucleobase:cation symporter-2